jgi:hypothetical protein
MKPFREELIRLGVPIGRKHEKVALPLEPCSEVDYFRGWVDGDGSLGLDSKGLPFLSLTTKSDAIKKGFLSFLRKITGKDRVLNKNKRDDIYNICLRVEDAQKVAKVLYYIGCICINRKLQKSKEVLQWKRPITMRIRKFKRWGKEEDRIILHHTLGYSIKKLSRTEKSISIRLLRLRYKKQGIVKY